MPRANQPPSPNVGGGKYGEISGRHGGNASDALQGLEEVIGETIIACLTSGDAVFFGSTRDGSAVCVRVYSESGNGEWFEGSPSGLDTTLRAIRAAALDT